MKSSQIHAALAVLVAFVAIGGCVFGYYEVTNVKAEAGALAGETAAKDAERSRASSARSALTELSEKEAFIASHLVSSADIVSFLERLEAAGDEFGAGVEVASVSGEPSADGIITTSLSITGSFDAVLRTLGVIEHGELAARAKSLTLDTGGDGTWSASGIFLVGTRSVATSTTP